MIQKYMDYGLPEPEFKDTGTSIVVVFRKSRLTKELMNKMGLNERQKKAVEFLKEQEKIARSAYEKKFNISGRTANRELSDLVKAGILEKKGSGRSIHYVLSETSPNLAKRVQKTRVKYVLR